jgi:hypothetical protein
MAGSSAMELIPVLRALVDKIVFITHGALLHLTMTNRSGWTIDSDRLHHSGIMGLQFQDR